MTSPIVQSLTDEFIEELESCRLADCGIDLTAEEVSAILSERAELKADAERYRYIRTEGMPDPAIAIVDSYYGVLELVSPDHLDAAIDTAIQEYNK